MPGSHMLVDTRSHATVRRINPRANVATLTSSFSAMTTVVPGESAMIGRQRRQRGSSLTPDENAIIHVVGRSPPSTRALTAALAAATNLTGIHVTRDAYGTAANRVLPLLHKNTAMTTLRLDHCDEHARLDNRVPVTQITDVSVNVASESFLDSLIPRAAALTSLRVGVVTAPAKDALIRLLHHCTALTRLVLIVGVANVHIYSDTLIGAPRLKFLAIKAQAANVYVSVNTLCVRFPALAELNLYGCRISRSTAMLGAPSQCGIRYVTVDGVTAETAVSTVIAIPPETVQSIVIGRDVMWLDSDPATHDARADLLRYAMRCRNLSQLHVHAPMGAFAAGSTTYALLRHLAWLNRNMTPESLHVVSADPNCSVADMVRRVGAARTKLIQLTTTYDLRPPQIRMIMDKFGKFAARV